MIKFNNFHFFLTLLIMFLFGIPKLLAANIPLANNEALLDITHASITIIEKAIETRKITCEELIMHHLDRINKYNLDISRGGAINAFVSLTPLVMDEARKLDNYFETTKKLVGPLHCIPIVVKDNINTYDSTSTSGSLALLGSQPNRDAFLVAELRKAGAIIIGKGTMDEFASGMIGVSSRSGRTGNAYDPTQNPGGSSAGPAAAVSAGFAVVGIGTDNSGSIRVPAAFNGIYGLRPSTGLISQSGIFPRGNLDGIAGPLTRSIKDMAIVLSLITKPDTDDKLTLKHPVVQSYVDFLDKETLEGLRIGVVKSVVYTDSKKLRKLYSTFFNKLNKMGVTLVDIELPDFNTNRKSNMAGEIQQINQYLSSFPSTRRNFADICTSRRTNIFHGIEGCFQHIRETPPVNSVAYHDVLKMFATNRNYVQDIMNKYKLDVLLTPITSFGTATYDINSVLTAKLPISSNAGLPSLVLNIGYIGNGKVQMPVGVEIIGKFYGEGVLLQIAAVIEKNLEPKLVPILETATTKDIINHLNISEYNNLLTLIGDTTYNKFLVSNKPNNLTHLVFNELLTETLKLHRVDRIRSFSINNRKCGTGA